MPTSEYMKNYIHKPKGSSKIGRDQHEKLKKKFLQLFRESHGMVYQTIHNTGISKETYYRWYKGDQDFADKINEIKEEVTDIVESQLIKNIQNGKEISAIFYLKCKARDRGYIEIQNVESKVEQKQISIGVIDPETKKLMEETVKLLNMKEIKQVEAVSIDPVEEKETSIDANNQNIQE